MGHTINEIAPNGFAEEIRLDQEREWQRNDELAARSALRDERSREIRQKYSGEELPQAEVRDRIAKIQGRIYRITSAIPVPVTLHLLDGEDEWYVSATQDPDQGQRILFERQNAQYREVENFVFEAGQDFAEVRHFERGQLELIIGKNSERELAPAEELFERLISPLEVQMGIAPSTPIEVFPAE